MARYKSFTFPTVSPSSPAIVDVTCSCIFVSFIMRIMFVFNVGHLNLYIRDTEYFCKNKKNVEN